RTDAIGRTAHFALSGSLLSRARPDMPLLGVPAGSSAPLRGPVEARLWPCPPGRSRAEAGRGGNGPSGSAEKRGRAGPAARTRQTGREARMEEVRGADCVERIGVELLGRAPGLHRLVVTTRPVERQPEVECDERAARMLRGKLLQAAERPVRPGGDGRAHVGLERLV